MTEKSKGPESSRLDTLAERFAHAYLKLGRVAAATALSFAGGAVAMNTIGQSHERIGPIETTIGLKIGPDGTGESWLDSLNGGTDAGINQLRVRFPTHDIGPRVAIEPRDIDLAYFKPQPAQAGKNEATAPMALSKGASQDMERIIENKEAIIARSIGSFVLGAGLTSLLIGAARRRTRHETNEVASYPRLGLALANGILFSTASVGAVQYAHNPQAFLEPQKTGAIAQAEVMAKSMTNLGALDRGALKSIQAQMAFMDLIEAEAERRTDTPTPTLILLIKSDDHLRDDSGIIQAELNRTHPDAIIDLGDQTDFGDAIENQIAANRIPRNIPYFYLVGNHDRDSTATTIGALPHTEVAKRGEFKRWEINGLSILAVGDPFYSVNSQSISPEEVEATTQEFQQKITNEVNRAAAAGEPYDILMTHEPYLYEDLKIDVAGMAAGHRHIYEFSSEKDKPWQLQVGSIGGAGRRMLMNSSDDIPTAQQYNILFFSSSCQLIKETNISITSLGPEAQYSQATQLNNNYDKNNTSARCE